MLSAHALSGLEGKAQDRGTKEEAVAVIRVRAILSGLEGRMEVVGVTGTRVASNIFCLILYRKFVDLCSSSCFLNLVIYIGVLSL